LILTYLSFTLLKYSFNLVVEEAEVPRENHRP
jgi:hypothetical protein